MIETIKNGWINLQAVGVYPLITIASFVGYMLFVQMFLWDKRRAFWVAVSISLLGQIYYSLLPDKIDIPETIAGVLFFTVLQAIFSVGLYSFLDKYGLMDRVGKLMQKKIEDKTGGTNA